MIEIIITVKRLNEKILRNSVHKSKYYLKIMNEAEYLLKNYGDRGGCYP